MWSPVDRSATTCGAGSLLPGCGGHCARFRALGRRGRVPSNPHGSRGWYGARGFSLSPYPVGCPWGANGVLDLAGPRYEPSAADSVDLFRHLLPGARVVALSASLRALNRAVPTYLVRL